MKFIANNCNAVELIFMYQKVVEKESYSKKDLARIRKNLKNGIEAYKKDPEFKKAVKAFIKKTA